VATSKTTTTETETASPQQTVRATAPEGKTRRAGRIARGVSDRLDQRGRQRPIVVEIRKGRRRRGRKRYTRGFRDIQRFAYGGSRALYRFANGFASGFDSFRSRSNRSSRRKKDGLVRDSLRNGARAFSRSARQFGRVPYELAREVRTRRFWRAGRDLRGLLIPPPLAFFLR